MLLNLLLNRYDYKKKETEVDLRCFLTNNNNNNKHFTYCVFEVMAIYLLTYAGRMQNYTYCLGHS